MSSRLNSSNLHFIKLLTFSIIQDFILADAQRLAAIFSFVILNIRSIIKIAKLNIGGDVFSPFRAVHVIGVAARRCSVKPDRD